MERQTNHLRLTKKSVEATVAGWKPGGPRRYWDTELPGLYLQFTPAGYPSYVLRFTRPSGAKGDFTIGSARIIAPDQAREAARAKLAQLLLTGEDPVASRNASRNASRTASERTFEAVARRYLDTKAPRLRGPSHDEDVLTRHVFPVIGSMQISDVTRQKVKDIVATVQLTVATRNVDFAKERNGKTTANRVHAAIRRVFDYAIDDEIVQINPAAMKRLFSHKPSKRKGVVTEQRFQAIWNEMSERTSVYRQGTTLAVQLYMLTLQRPIDIARAERSHFDFRAMGVAYPQ